ncbi:MAG: hypothetical protein ACLTS1_12550, partial [Coprococcus sp.]
MKYSLFVNEYEEDNSDLLLTQEALSLIERKEPDFVYLYLVETDDKGGHDHGWMTSEYMHRVNNAFSCQSRQVYESCPLTDTPSDHRDHGGPTGDTAKISRLTFPMRCCFENKPSPRLTLAIRN